MRARSRDRLEAADALLHQVDPALEGRAFGLTTLLQQVGVARIGRTGRFVRIRGVEQLEGLDEEFVSALVVLGVMPQLRQRDERLSARLGITAALGRLERGLRFLLGFGTVAALDQQFSQAAMAGRGRDIIIEFLFDTDGLQVFPLRAVEIALLLQRFMIVLGRLPKFACSRSTSTFKSGPESAGE